jgi:hypothetical protein
VAASTSACAIIGIGCRVPFPSKHCAASIFDVHAIVYSGRSGVQCFRPNRRWSEQNCCPLGLAISNIPALCLVTRHEVASRRAGGVGACIFRLRSKAEPTGSSRPGAYHGLKDSRQIALQLSQRGLLESDPRTITRSVLIHLLWLRFATAG